MIYSNLRTWPEVIFQSFYPHASHPPSTLFLPYPYAPPTVFDVIEIPKEDTPEAVQFHSILLFCSNARFSVYAFLFDFLSRLPSVSRNGLRQEKNEYSFRHWIIQQWLDEIKCIRAVVRLAGFAVSFYSSVVLVDLDLASEHIYVYPRPRFRGVFTYICVCVGLEYTKDAQIL